MQTWRALPILLKILAILLALWAAMSIAVLVTMPERQIPFFGVMLQAPASALVVALLDVLSPLAFLYALWRRLRWGATFGMAYNGVFILNGVFTLVLFRDVFGNAAYPPLVASVLFFAIIYRQRNYFA